MIRNQTLKFLSKTLPVLKADDTLPKVTQIIRDEPVDSVDNNNIDRHHNARAKRATPPQSQSQPRIEGHEFSYFDPALDEEQRTNSRVTEERKPRKFCDGGGV